MLILLWPLLLCAQDYQNICAPGTAFFIRQDSGLRAFRRDAFTLPGNSDTIFYSYPAIGLIADQYGCFDTAMGSVLGRRVYKKHDGWFYFFNASGDTLKINTQAALGASWKFCALPGTDWLQATYSSAVTENILGTSDEVKVITLQAKNQAGVNIENQFNQKAIRLSKHFGLVTMYDVNFIPADTTAWSIAGKASQAAGLHEISWKDVYTFDLGDEFHFSRVFGGYGSGGTEKRILRVLERVVYGNWDSVSYFMQRCSAMDYGPPATHTTSFDSAWVKYDLNELAADSSIYRLPDEFAPDGDYCWQYYASQSFNGRAVKGRIPNVYGHAPGDTCWGMLVGDGWWDSGFSEGLGQVFFHYYTYTGASNTDRLVYFRKGSETWGTPLAPSCTILVDVAKKNTDRGVKITVSPNPVGISASVSVYGLRPDEDLRFTLSDPMGRVIYSSPAFNPTFSFSRGSLPPGLYILCLFRTDGSLVGNARVMLE